MNVEIFTQAHDKQTVEVALGEPFTVELPENPTTGFRWHFETDPSVQVLSSVFRPPPSTRIGAGGIRSVTFRSSAEGRFNITAKLWREWLGDSSVVRRFEISLYVKPAELQSSNK